MTDEHTHSHSHHHHSGSHGSGSHHNKHHRSKNDRRSSKIRVIIGALAVVLTLAIVAGAVTLYDRYQQKQLQEQLAGQGHQRSEILWSDADTLDFGGDVYGFDHRMESFLLVGTDASGNEQGEGEDYRGTMADFLLLMVLDYTDDTYGYLQIDRNTITNVNVLNTNGELLDYNDQQICTAHWYGGNPEESAENTVLAVSELLGYLENISGYYVLNMSDIGVLNSAVGGVEVTIDEDMSNVDPAMTEGATLTLTDEQAERFVRARMNVGQGDNVSRMARQRVYMDSFFRNVKEKTQKNANFYNELWTALRHAGTTTMNGNAFSRIANMFLKGESKGILTLDGEVRTGIILEDGLEHEEFYPTDASVLSAMDTLYSLVPVDVESEEDVSEEDFEEDYEDDTEDWLAFLMEIGSENWLEEWEDESDDRSEDLEDESDDRNEAESDDRYRADSETGSEWETEAGETVYERR